VRARAEKKEKAHLCGSSAAILYLRQEAADRGVYDGGRRKMRGVRGEKVLAEEGRARRGETVGRAAGTLKFKAANFWIRFLRQLR